MGIFDGCLLACDIDGTLLFDKTLPERNIDRINRFVREGGAFSLATGRTSQALIDVTSKIKCIAPSALSNGCVLFDFEKQKPISEKLLSKKSLHMVADVVETLKIGVEMHAASVVYVPSRSAASDLHEQYESMQAEFVDVQRAIEKRINKVIYFIENKKQEEQLLKLSEKYKGECVFYRTSTFIGGVKQSYLEQIPFGVSKAGALIELCKILNVKKGGFFAIGDYYNDVEMITAADIGAVPANSPEDIKKQASVVVGHAADGAVADFIEYLEGIFENGQTNQIKP